MFLMKFIYLKVVTYQPMLWVATQQRINNIICTFPRNRVCCFYHPGYNLDCFMVMK